MRYQKAKDTLEKLKPFADMKNRTPGWDARVISIIVKYEGGVNGLWESYIVGLSNILGDNAK